MSLRTIASFAIAIFLGLIAVIMVRGVISSQKPGPAGPATGTVPVVVAASPIDRGVTVTPAMVKVVGYPKDAVPEGAFQSMDQLVGKAAPVRTTERSITTNEPVLLSKLSGPGSKANLSGAIDAGMRAVSVRSTDVSGVGGFVLPGDRVDVLLTRATGSGANSNDAAHTITQVLAQNALVLGVDQVSDQEADKPVVAKAVTVEVTPEQAQAISLGGTIGQVSLDLRQASDHTPLAHDITTVDDLGGVRPKAAAPRRRARIGGFGLTEVHVVRGVDATTYSVGSF